jgi:SAM-dependent methyltransferase
MTDAPTPPRTLRYFPEVFETADLAAAKAIILTDEGPGADTQTRWEQETPYVLELIAEHLAPRPGMVVLDYGCGVGRLAKPLIETFGCHVIGVDISAAMRALSVDYVRDERFLAVSPTQFDALIAHGLSVDAAFTVWVLQHCFEPRADVARIRAGLAPGARAFVLNMKTRAMPTVDADPAAARFQWASDGQDVAALLRESLVSEAEGEPDPARTPNMADAGAVWMRLRRPL